MICGPLGYPDARPRIRQAERRPRRGRAVAYHGRRARRAAPLRRALDLVGELTKGADRAGRHLAAALALLQRDGIGPLERRPALLEEAEEEVVLGAWRIVLHPAQDLLVGDRRGALRERALIHDVVDPAEEGVRRGLLLRQPIEGFHAADELRMRGRQRR